MGKRICLVINSLVQGGAQKSAILLAEELQLSGNHVQILTFYPEETDFFVIPEGIEVQRFVHPFQDRGRVKGNRLTIRFRRLINRVRDFIDLRKCFALFEPDLVISFEAATSVIAYFSKRYSCPMIISERVHPAHHPIPRWSRILRPLVYKSKFSVLHCQGKQIATWMEKKFRKNTFVIPNFVGSEMQDIWSSKSRKIKIFSRYSPQKGIDLAIDGWAQLPFMLRNSFSLEIFGDGDRTMYQKMIDNYGLNSSIKLFGPTKNLEKEFSDCLVFLMPSRFEGFPNSLIEAMNFGIPCLVTDCPSAVRDLTLDGKLAKLCQPTAEDISRNLLELLSDQTLLIEFGKAGKQVSNIFDDSNTILEWLDLINWVVSGCAVNPISCKSCSIALTESATVGYRTQHGLVRELRADWNIHAKSSEMGKESILFAFKCRHCGTVSFSGQKGSEDFYDTVYMSSTYSRKDAWDYFFVITELSKKNTHMEILDFGGGNSPLAALNDYPKQLTVIDLSTSVRLNMEAKGVKCFASLDDLPQGKKFDFIMLSHTIEHVDKPVELLRTLIHLLNKSGTIVITTPDSENEMLLHSPLAWPPHHTVAFKPSALRKEMITFGLQDVQIRRNEVERDSGFDFMLIGVK